MYLAKAKSLISCAVTAQLICVFVFAYMYAKSRFSYDATEIIKSRIFFLEGMKRIRLCLLIIYVN